MYLKEFKIKNFRSIKETCFSFSPGINILIGENNSGKSTVIDALRICFGFKDLNSLNVSKNDFNIFNPDNDIEFDLSFHIDEDYERGYFIELYNAKRDTLDLHYRFSLNNELPYERIIPNIWGGENEGEKIPNEIFHLFIHVYLDALRDSKRYLNPGRFNKLGYFISNIDEKIINEQYDKELMISELNSLIESSTFSKFVTKINKKYINEHLNNMIFDDEEFNMRIESLSKDFDHYCKNLEINVPISLNNEIINDLKLNQSGLGYNNLVYISIILSHLSLLKEQQNSLFLSLLIEEPESHLQPQLQNLFFTYLNEINEELNKEKSFQIFITSHSPTLTAKANLDSIIILQNFDNNVINSRLNSIITDEDNRKYLHKFLDVTKSQLLFSKRIIFVEGISEALLIPIFARKLGYELDKKGIEIVMVQGITFKHFIPLFKKENDLAFKGVIITDDDRKDLNGKESNAYLTLKKYENTHNIEIWGAKKTFEYELLTSNNENVIWNTLRQIHERKFKNITSNDNDKLFDIFNDTNKKINKADFALELSMKLNEDSNYNIPDYIISALDYICGD